MNDLPDGWEWSTIGDLADTQLGKMLSRKSKTGVRSRRYLRNVNVQWHRIDLQDVAEMDFNEDESAKYNLVPGDLLVCEGGEVGRTATWRGAPTDMHFQKALHRVRPIGGIEPKYLEYTMRWCADTKRFASLVTGSTIAHLPQQALRQVSVPVPPIAEQRRIVTAIEEHFSRLDAAEAALGRCLRRLERMGPRALDRALSEPNSWPTAAMSEVAQLSLGKMLDQKQQTGEHPTPYLRNINVRWGSFDTSDLAVMDITPHELERVTVRAGDVVMCEGGEPGRCAVWNSAEPVAIQKALHRIRLDGRVLPEFAALKFRQLAATGRLETYFTGSTIKHLPKQQLSRIEITIPPLAVQQEVVDEIDALEVEASRLRKALTESSTRSAALRRSILGAAFTGQLVRQDPSDEPASLLLERIAAERAASKPPRKKKAAS